MRRGLLVLLAPVIFGAAAVAQTQVGALIQGDHIVFPVKPEAVVARVSPDEVVSRMLSFDRNHDGKVAGSELAERMQPLMARADVNRDGALDVGEIRAIAAAPPPPPPPPGQGRIGGPFGGSYGFADDAESFSSRNHVEGAIDDLKLAADAKEQALSIAKTFVDTLEADAAADLAKELEGILSPEQLNVVKQLLEAQAQSRNRLVVRGNDGAIIKRNIFVKGLNLRTRIERLSLTPEYARQARAAVDHFMDRIKMGEAERAALVDQLKPVLNVEERDNLRAALARRPVVATGGTAAFAVAVADRINDFNVVVRPQEGKTFKFSPEGASIRTAPAVFIEGVHAVPAVTGSR